MHTEDKGPKFQTQRCAYIFCIFELVFLLVLHARRISDLANWHQRWYPGIILSGSPYSVYDDDAPHVDTDVFELGVPILGICYGLQVRSFNTHVLSRVLHLLCDTNRKWRGI